MAKSCKGLAMELVKCLSESDCVKVENRDYRECAKEKSPKISSECVGLRETYFNCKRGQRLHDIKHQLFKNLVELAHRVLTVIVFFQNGQNLIEPRDRLICLLCAVDMRARIRGNKGY